MTTEITIVADPPPLSHIDQIRRQIESLSDQEKQVLMAQLIPGIVNLGNNAVSSTIIFQLNGANTKELISALIDGIGAEAMAEILKAIARKLETPNN
jgi:hypothetical protein